MNELVAEVAFAGFMAVVVFALVLNVLIALYRERRANKRADEGLSTPPRD
jgi:hypothetical protein